MKIIIDMRGVDEDRDGEIMSYVVLPRVNWVVQLLKYGVGVFGQCNFLFKPKCIKKDLKRTFDHLYDIYEEGKERDRKEFISRFPGSGEAVVLTL